MKAKKYLEELIDLEQDYLSQYDDDEKPQHHVERLRDLKEAIQQVNSVDLADVGERSFIAVSAGKIIHKGTAEKGVDRIQKTFDAVGNKATVANYYWVIS